MGEEQGRRRARGELESEVMAALWAAEQPLTPAAVQAALGGGLAYNTVQTLLTRLVDKDLVRRKPAGRRRGHAYWPARDAATSAAEKMRAALDDRPGRGAGPEAVGSRVVPHDAVVLLALLTERES